jgi:hypothetical protein
MLRYNLSVFILFVGLSSAFAQKLTKLPEYSLSQTEAEAHLRFLASDEMLGRRTGEVTNNVAARYIAEQFRKLGVKTAPGQADYLQKVPLEYSRGGKTGEIFVGKDTLKAGKDFVMLSGKAAKFQNVPVVFVGYGWVDESQNDYRDLDVKGKIVVCQFGIPNNDKPFENMTGSTKKAKFAADNGALALIQVYNLNFPFASIVRNFGGERLMAASGANSEIPHLWVNSTYIKQFSKENLTSLGLNVGEIVKKQVPSYNVVGVIEGTDPKLKNEYLVLSAHFDHIGAGKSYGKVTEADSIFNGTRDNAMGTTALLMAARSFSDLKPKRSILLIGYTGEEMGMLGSKYYAENPLLPLKQCVFNLNSDGAGYNDSTKVTINGLDRTDAEQEIKSAARAFGIEAINDPAPEQNLFDRSDNVSLAAKGIPAPNMAPGFTSFDAEIGKYYHQAVDNPENISMSYLVKFCKVYSYSARLIANRTNAPKWKAGDKYESAGRALYGK